MNLTEIKQLSATKLSEMAKEAGLDDARAVDGDGLAPLGGVLTLAGLALLGLGDLGHGRLAGREVGIEVDLVGAIALLLVAAIVEHNTTGQHMGTRVMGRMIFCT